MINFLCFNMSNISPNYVLKRSGESVMDLNFWNFNNSSILLAAYGGEGGVDLWDMKTRRSILNISSSVPLLSVCGFKSEEILMFDKEGNMKIVEVCNGSYVNKFHLTIPDVAFCKAGALPQACQYSSKLVAVPGESTSSVNVWDISQQHIISRLIPPSCVELGKSWCIKLIDDGKLVAVVGYEDGSMLFWDVLEGRILAKAINLFNDPLMCFDAFKDEKTKGCFNGVSGSVTNALIKWNINSMSDKNLCGSSPVSNKNTVSNTLSNITDFNIVQQTKLLNSGLSCIKIRFDKKLIATGGWDYKVRLFSWKNLKPLAVLEYHTKSVQAIAFSNYATLSENVLACGSADNKISIWKVYNS